MAWLVTYEGWAAENPVEAAHQGGGYVGKRSRDWPEVMPDPSSLFEWGLMAGDGDYAYLRGVSTAQDNLPLNDLMGEFDGCYRLVYESEVEFIDGDERKRWRERGKGS